jgi:hypothetical protein
VEEIADWYSVSSAHISFAMGAVEKYRFATQHKTSKRSLR